MTKFLELSNKRIALMGMSGVGKTYLSNQLPKDQWFHYSIDYRIGTRYLNEAITDCLKKEAMKLPTFKKLLSADSIYIAPNITIDHLAPLSYYVGMVGNESLGGLPFEEFTERLEKHRQAEIAAINDTTEFIKKAQDIYNYPHFICDLSGSVCEIDSEETLKKLSENCLIVYIKATENMKHTLIERSQTHPKPLYYQYEFLKEKTEQYCTINQLNSTKEIDPADFAIWIFPQLIDHRIVRYEAIAEKYGITIDAISLQQVKNEHDFITLIDQTLNAQKREITYG